MDFIKSPQENEKLNSLEEFEKQNDSNLNSYDPEMEDKYKRQREIVAQSGDGEIWWWALLNPYTKRVVRCLP